jgi:hypothetical protein
VCVRSDGTKELVAVADGCCRSPRVLGGPSARPEPAGVPAPVLSVGDEGGLRLVGCRYQSEGLAGLEDRSSRPHRTPSRTKASK